jgi:RsiW-degrading membrane proteinase PrsW (M82 family)
MTLRSLRLGRWKHLATLLPLGLALGAIGGLIGHELLFGIAVGAGFAVFYGLLFALRNVQ